MVGKSGGSDTQLASAPAPSSPSKTSLARLPKPGTLSPAARARHAALAAMDVYSVTNKGITRSKSSTSAGTGAPAGRTGAAPARPGLPQRSGGSATLRQPLDEAAKLQAPAVHSGAAGSEVEAGGGPGAVPPRDGSLHSSRHHVQFAKGSLTKKLCAEGWDEVCTST